MISTHQLLFSVHLSLIILLSTLIFGSHQDCPSGWTPFSDEKCFKVLMLQQLSPIDTLTPNSNDTDNNNSAVLVESNSQPQSQAPQVLTFEQAERACAAEEQTNVLDQINVGAQTNLATIKSLAEQRFLTNHLFKVEKYETNFWLGAKSVNRTTFKWTSDGSPIDEGEYSNFHLSLPKQQTNYQQFGNFCLQLQHYSFGKWVGVSCDDSESTTTAAVICEQTQAWSVLEIQRALIAARRRLKAQERELANQRAELDSLRQNPSIPIGFVYTQLPDQPEPSELWVFGKWTDVSALYSGVFFRVLGNGSDEFGATQHSNDHRVLRMERAWWPDDVQQDLTVKDHVVYEREDKDPVQRVKYGGWMHTGDRARQSTPHFTHMIRLVTSSGEVRPRNMAVKLWKRTA